MSKKCSQLRVSKVYSFVIRQKDSPNCAEVIACVVDLFDTDKVLTELVETWE